MPVVRQKEVNGMNTVMQAVAPIVAQMFAVATPIPVGIWFSKKFGLSDYPLLTAVFKSEEELALMKFMFETMARQGVVPQNSQALQAWLFKNCYAHDQATGQVSVSQEAQAYLAIQGRFQEILSKSEKPHKVERSSRVEAGMLWKDTCKELEMNQTQVNTLGAANIDKMSIGVVGDMQRRYAEKAALVQLWTIRREQVKLICNFVGYEIKK